MAGLIVLKRGVRAFLVVFNISLGLVVLYMLMRGYQPPAPNAQTIEYKDFVSILLSVLAVMVAVATILLAAAAIWGFTVLRDEIRSVASKEAKSTAEAVARDVAASVATRTARETAPADTPPEEAAALADALVQDGQPHA